MDSDEELDQFLVKAANFEPAHDDFDEYSNSNAEIVYSTTSASSAVSSNPNSPRTHSGFGSHSPVTVDEGSLGNDLLTEEAEEDLANNNDPNNNASNNDNDEFNGDEIDSEASVGASVATETQNSVDCRNEFRIDSISISPNPIDSPAIGDDIETDPELDEDVSTIRKLLPHKSELEIRNHLEAYIFHPKRLKIVLNNLLEEQLAEERVNKKDKTGNGLKCKNRSRPIQTTSANPTETGSPDQGMAFEIDDPKPSSSTNLPRTSPTALTFPDFSSQIESRQSAATKRKLPPPSCTVTSQDQEIERSEDEGFHFNLFGKSTDSSAGNSQEAGPAESTSSAAGSSGLNRPRRGQLLDLNLDEHDLISDIDREPKRARGGGIITSSATSSSSNSNNEMSGQKIEISEDHLYGPFNFSAHRPEAAKNARQKLKAARQKATFRVRDDLSVDQDGATSSASRSPLLIDLGTGSEGEATPPPLVDISQADQHEIQELVKWLCGMFPDTPKRFIKEQAEDLVGKPAALDRFISEHLGRNGAVPDDWVPRERARTNDVLSLDPGLPPPAFIDIDPPEPAPAENPAAIEPEDHHVEDKVERQLNHLLSVFPNTDPECLHAKVLEFTDKEEEMVRWIDETLENSAAGLPTRKDYEKRLKEAELLEKYSGQVTVKEILEMYDNDPESFFMDTTRKVSDLYKRHALGQLKKEFRHTAVNAINKVFADNAGLFLPSYRALKQYHGPKRKTKRQDHEAPMPTEIDINFLKELQYARKEAEVRKYLDELESDRQKKLEFARENKTLRECDCCSNEECLDEDMLPCSKGHYYCKECIQRASAVAIGDGKTELKCLIHCDQSFALSTLQKALGANTFSKWLEKIQLAEIEKAGLVGLEQCPFCPFATIMDEPKEENKVFTCLNPECGKESCRICKEMSHIPLRCEEVEKDVEVRKRTYIENKMAEALIRTCYKCKRPYVKQDGCNKITCSNCGALMCYICRSPVTGYDHFAGQGMEHVKDKCPLWSDNNSVHDRDVALGALEAKNEMDKEQPEVTLKHDPTAGLNLDQVRVEKSKKTGGAAANAAAQDFPPGLEGFLPQDPFERERMIEEQRRIERIIQHGGDPAAAAGGMIGAQMFPFFNHAHQRDNGIFVNYPAPWGGNNDHLLHRMGELLRLREDQRQRQRLIRRREQLALQEVRLHEIGLPAPPAAAAAAAAPPPPPAATGGPAVPPVLPHHHININAPIHHNVMHHTHHHHHMAAAAAAANHHHAMVYPPPPAHRQVPPRAVPPPPPAHPGIPRPAHVAPQPPALPLTFGPRQPADIHAGNLYRFQLEPIPLRRLHHQQPPMRPAPHRPGQQGQVPQPRGSPDLVQRELEMLFEN